MYLNAWICSRRKIEIRELLKFQSYLEVEFFTYEYLPKKIRVVVIIRSCLVWLTFVFTIYPILELTITKDFKNFQVEYLYKWNTFQV